MTELGRHREGYFFALGAVLIWSGFILVSRSGGISPLLSYDIIAIRYVTCATLVFPVWFFWKRFNLLQVKFVVSSLIGGLGYALLAFNGFKTTSASHAAVLLPGLLPIFIAILSSFFNTEQHAWAKWLGILVISVGVAVLFWHELTLAGALSMGHLSLIGAAFCWATFSVLINHWHIRPWEATISLALITCAIYLPVYLMFLPKMLSTSLLHEIALQAFYQGFMATILQMLLYVRAVQTIGAANMGAMMAIVPILAGFSAIAVFNETLSSALIMSLLLVSFGVWLANSRFRLAGKI